MSSVEAASEGAAPQLVGEALDEALKAQVQFYFSRDNLSKDRFISSQMDAQGFVSIATVATFPKLKALTANLELITRAMRASPTLVVDETSTLVRVNQRAHRTTLILRNIPSELSEAEVKALFDFPDCPIPKTVKAEYGNTWFVTFGSQSDVESADSLLKAGRQFNGKQISCHIKSERGFTPLQTTGFVPPAAAGGYQWSQSASFYPRNSTFYQQPLQQFPQRLGSGPFPGPGAYPDAKTTFRREGRNQRIPQSGQPKQFDSAASAGGVSAKTSADVATESKTGSGTAADGGPNTPRSGDKSKKRQGKKTDGKGKDAPDPQFGSADFPALPTSTRKSERDKSERDNADVKYTRDDFIRIVDAVVKKGDNPRPNTMPSSLGFARDTPLTTTQLGEPFPIIYPASPIPELAAQAHSSADLMPFLDLDYMPSVDQPVAVNQEQVATAVAQAQGIEVPEMPRERRQSTSSFSSNKRSSITAPADADEFKTVNNRKPRREGGRGGHGERSSDFRGGGHGHGGERREFPAGERGGRGGHGGRGGGRGDRSSGDKASSPRRPEGAERRPRDPAQKGDRRPRNLQNGSAEPATAPVSTEPKKQTLADILKQNEEKAKLAGAGQAADAKAPAKSAAAAQPKPVAVAAAAAEQKPKAASKASEGKKAPVEPAAKPTTDETKSASVAAASKSDPSPSPSGGKPSYAELLKRQAEAKELAKEKENGSKPAEST